MLVSSVIYCISLSLIVKEIKGDENINAIKETFTNDIDSKSLEHNHKTTELNVTPKLLLPYKPFKKPIKGNTKPKNSSLSSATKPSIVFNSTKKKKKTTLKPNHQFIENLSTTVESSTQNDVHITELTATVNNTYNDEITTTSLPSHNETSLVEFTTTPSHQHDKQNTNLLLLQNDGNSLNVMESSTTSEHINLITIINTPFTTLIYDDKEIKTPTNTATSVNTTFPNQIESPATVLNDDPIETDASTSKDDDVPETYEEEFSEICDHKYEYHAIEGECDTYIFCKKSGAYRTKCPEGLLFNSMVLWPNYPCSYPFEVKCKGKITQASSPTAECKHQYGYFPSSRRNCSEYVMCQEGTAFPLSCPVGLVFNSKTSSCDWPANVPDCPFTALDIYKCPESSSVPVAEPKYRYGNSCRDYVLCLEGHPRLLKCDLGLAFDEYHGFCVNSEYIQNCV